MFLQTDKSMDKSKAIMPLTIEGALNYVQLGHNKHHNTRNNDNTHTHKTNFNCPSNSLLHSDLGWIGGIGVLAIK